MSVTVLRTAEGWWVQDPRRAGPPRIGRAQATRELLADRAAVDKAAAVSGTDEGAAVPGARPAVPVTAPCRVVAQMVNYRSHAKDSGFDPDAVLPTFFRKASSSITGPTGRSRGPVPRRLLDYEVEIGLVLGATCR